MTVLIFAIYFIVILVVGVLAGRKGNNSADDYFLAGRRLPWYAVGLSMIGSNISTEHFVGMVGSAFLFGIAPANYELTAFFAMTVFIFFFLPYYFRSKIYTIPQFLEQRFNSVTRTLFAGLTITHMVIVLLAGALYAGGLIFQEIFASPEAVQAAKGSVSSSLLIGIVIIAVTTGAYSVYGGLSSVVWTDVVQVIILVFAGAFVTVVALDKAGGLHAVWEANKLAEPLRVHLIRPANDSFAPWTGIVTLWLTLGVWYNCTNQFYIQRCFGARSEWDSKMGVIMAGFIKQLLPLIIVVPGLIAFALYGAGLEADKVFITMVKDHMPPLIKSIVLTGMAAAIMSTVSSLLNSSSTIFTIDLYQQYINKNADQKQLVRIGRLATVAVLVIAMVWAPFISLLGNGLFVYIQDMSSYFAPPISAIFVVGILWRRATARAANCTLVLGIVVGIILKILGANLSGPAADIISPFLNRALFNWMICMLLMFSISLYTSEPGQVATADGIIWKPSYSRLPAEERVRYSGWKNILIWWGAVMAIRIVTYLFFG